MITGRRKPAHSFFLREDDMTKEPFMVSWQAMVISVVLWLIILLVVYGAWQ